MPTTKLKLPTIGGHNTPDVPRDLNALAEAIDLLAGVSGGLALINGQGQVVNANGDVAGANPPDATTLLKGIVMLSNLINGTSEGKAATELAVKNAKEAAINFAKSFGLGDVAKSITGTNLNDIVLNGTYMGENLVNAPNNFWYFIEHFQHNESFAKQVAHPFTDYGANNPTLYRLKLSGAWQPWTRYLDSTMINVPNGVIGLDENGNAPGNLTGKKIKIAEVDFSNTPGMSVDFIIPEGMKKVIIEGEIEFEANQTGNTFLQFNDITAIVYQYARLSGTTTSGNTAQVMIHQSQRMSPIYVEIDADSPQLSTRSQGAYSYTVVSLSPGNEVSRLQKVKFFGQAGTNIRMVRGIVTVWGDPI